jgi:hypothetical protein
VITIRPVYNQHKMTFSNPGTGDRGFSVMANSLEEIHLAIDHYHIAGHQSICHKARHEDNCPLCRMMVQERAKLLTIADAKVKVGLR